MGTENFQFRPQGAEKKGFEVGNLMFKNTTKLTFPQGYFVTQIQMKLGTV